MAQNGNIKTNIFQKLEKFGDLFIINILFIITSIPIFTIGAATTAMYAFTTKLVKDQEGPVWKSYWSAFKKKLQTGHQGVACHIGHIGSDVCGICTFVFDGRPGIRTDPRTYGT